MFASDELWVLLWARLRFLGLILTLSLPFLLSVSSGYQTLVMSIVNLSRSPPRIHKDNMREAYSQRRLWQQSRHREVLGTMREFEAKVSIPETTYGLKGARTGESP